MILSGIEKSRSELEGLYSRHILSSLYHWWGGALSLLELVSFFNARRVLLSAWKEFFGMVPHTWLAHVLVSQSIGHEFK
jgi:hypothetical protein